MDPRADRNQDPQKWPPPARRSTDLDIAIGLTGFALFGLIMLIRRIAEDDWVGFWTYLPPTLLITYPAVRMLNRIYRARRQRGKKRS
jgi:hypothetical protein